MRQLRRHMLLLGSMLLAGCHRAPKAAAVPPPPPLDMVSVPPPSHPTEPLPEEPLAAVPDAVPPTIPAPRIVPRRRAQPAPAPPTVVAVVTPPPATIDLGQLTTGGESNSALRSRTDDLLHAQARRLAALSASTAALHTQQVEQVRLFLKQANDAWTKQDVEGARILATKAKVLLDEILQ